MAILADEPDLVQLLINKRADVELGRTIQKNDERPFKLPLTLALHSTEKVAITQMLFDQYVKLHWAKNVRLDDLLPKDVYVVAKKIVLKDAEWDPPAYPVINTHYSLPLPKGWV